MQEKMKQAQDEIKSIQVKGESGAGMVEVIMNGRHDIDRVKINPELQSEDIKVLEDQITAAINDAVRKVEVQTKQKMGNVTGGLQMPPGLDLNL